MNKFVYLALVLITGVIVYRYRYSFVNAILRIRPLQTWLVRSAMSVPFVRNTIISQVFR
ncbi:hypothetical protein SAMN05192569_100119 [Parageobacillus thermantarcticus]|uniref:Uncharacterized protein n=1 Tax=Parageobacillus thermantarcticus TaxID=186116 RepID=A0A1I0SF80_9BACL|nr:hypothetical protein [Parageobacillus thermantarcticus]SFA38073.1 hypothetical protein SAMN05192569_100119 [Parageobacillus thermantarcticus]